MNIQPFRFGTGGDWGFRGGDWGLIHGDVLQWTNNHLGLGLGDWGFRGGDWGLIHGDVLQWTNNHLGLGLGDWGFRGGDWGLILRSKMVRRHKRPQFAGTSDTVTHKKGVRVLYYIQIIQKLPPSRIGHMSSFCESTDFGKPTHAAKETRLWSNWLQVRVVSW